MQVVGYILIKTMAGKAWSVAEAVSKLGGVKMAHSVTGPYDVIAHVEEPDLKALSELIKKIHAIEGIYRTQTAISV